MNQHPIIELFQWFRNLFDYLTYDHIYDIALHAPQYYIIWWQKLFHDTPEHVFIETTLVIFIVWLVFIRKTIDPKKISKLPKLTEKEINWLIESWQPEPLVPDITVKDVLKNSLIPVITQVNGLEVKLSGQSKSILNVSSYDFLGLGLDESVKSAARDALVKYGCGSCGPRGFYGSIDQHILFERALASFMGTQEAILYSDGSSAVSSTIPAFSKKGDLLIVDEACCESILTGCNLSRSIVHYYKHNDMQDLHAILKSIAKEDKRLRVDTTQQRRFIVSEGIFRNTGSICDLPTILKLGKEFFYRLVIDESISFGTLGKTGRGVTEHYGVSIYDIDIITLSLDTTLASIGGICIGTHEIVDHQRLNGAGYCFSASAPPFLSASALRSLQVMEGNPSYLTLLQENTKKILVSLQELEKYGFSMLNVSNSASREYYSPIIHFICSPRPLTRDEEEDMIIALYQGCLGQGIGVSMSKTSPRLHGATTLPPITNYWDKFQASVRLCSNAVYSDQDIKRIVFGICMAAKEVNSKRKNK